MKEEQKNNEQLQDYHPLNDMVRFKMILHVSPLKCCESLHISLIKKGVTIGMEAEL